MPRGFALRAAWRRFVRHAFGAVRIDSPAAEPVDPARPHPFEAVYPQGARWDMELESAPVDRFVSRAAEATPRASFLSFYGRSLSYRYSERLIDRLAANLARRGVGPGTRVGLMMPNCPWYAIAFYAVLRAGGVVVPFNPAAAPRELERQAWDSETSIMITLDLPETYPRAAGLLGQTPVEKLIVGSMAAMLPLKTRTVLRLRERGRRLKLPRDGAHLRLEELFKKGEPLDPPSFDPKTTLALLSYTGGVDGVPKAAALTHAALSANAAQIAAFSRSKRNEAERFVGVLPLFHAFGMTGVMNVAALLRSEVLLLPRFSPAELTRLMRRHKPTILCAVPTIFAALASGENLEDVDLSALRLCISGGAKLEDHVRDAFEAASGLTIIEGYGLTECAPVVTMNPPGARRPGSCGVPLPGTIVEIRDRDERTRRLGAGEVGEVFVRGPQLMSGYEGRPEATRAIFDPRGFLRTGDLGRLDEQGYLYFEGLAKPLIISGGFNVYPRLVEEALLLHPVVESAQVIGQPDKSRGQTVRAIVRPLAGKALTPALLRAFLRDKLSPYEWPRRIEIKREEPASPPIIAATEPPRGRAREPRVAASEALERSARSKAFAERARAAARSAAPVRGGHAEREEERARGA